MTSFPVTVSVVGLGPAGRIAAHRVPACDWDVTAYDPTGGTLPSTIGPWCDQLLSWLPSDFPAATFQPSVIPVDGTERQLTRTYGVVNKDCLQKLGGFHIERRVLTGSKTTGTDITIVITGRTYVVAGRGGQVRQLAIGHIFSFDDVPGAYCRAVLMDFTPIALNASKAESASFPYRIFLDNRTFFIEETILATPIPMVDGHRGEAGAPAGSGGEADDSLPLALLHRRQNVRLKSLGFSEDLVIGGEVVSFPLLTNLSSRYDALTHSGPFMGILSGFAGSWMYPAAGHSVGPVIEDIDRFLVGMKKKGGRALGTSLGIRLQRWPREHGLAALLGFDARQVGAFSRTLLLLLERDVFAYLIGISPLAMLCTMAKVAVPLLKMSPRTCGKLIAGLVWGPGRWGIR